jgi:Tol biopolymer transport system component
MRIHSLAAGALLVFLTAGAARSQRASGFELTLVGVDGTRTVLGRLPPSVFAPRVSPDGSRVAFETRDPAGPDGARLWVAELRNLAGRRPLPSVVGPQNWAPMWSVDGERLVFLVSGGAPDALYWRRADGSGGAEHLVDARSAEGWIGNGSQLRFLTLTGNRDYGISLLDMRSRIATSLIDLPGSAQHSTAVSPDGRWIAYASNETGRYEVWLEPLPRTGARHRLTRDGGGHPLWLPGGGSLYFDRGQRLFRLSVNTAAPSSLNEPVALPITGFVQGEFRRQFDLMPRGAQFLMLFPVTGD